MRWKAVVEKIAVIEPLVYLGIYLLLIAMRLHGWLRRALAHSPATLWAAPRR